MRRPAASRRECALSGAGRGAGRLVGGAGLQEQEEAVGVDHAAAVLHAAHAQRRRSHPSLHALALATPLALVLALAGAPRPPCPTHTCAGWPLAPPRGPI